MPPGNSGTGEAPLGTGSPVEPALDDDIWSEPDVDPPSDGGEADVDDEEAQGKSTARNLVEWVVVVGGAVLVAVLIRAFVLQTFWIPSPSMATTLVEKDRVIVNKLSYRLHDVNRGDVVVFHRPPNEPVSDIKDLIKRVVGLEGERVSIREGKVFIDGQSLDEPYTKGQATLDIACTPAEMQDLYTVEGFEIPDGHVFVMGDNRPKSGDSRCFGPIDEDLIVGRAFFKIWPPGHIGGL
jgi:signal peptidase I